MLPIIKKPQWRLEQAAVWIATRDPAQVVRYPFARLASGVASLKTDLAKAREDLVKANDAIRQIEREITLSVLIFGGQANDVARYKRELDHSKTLKNRVDALKGVVAHAIAIPDSTECDPKSPEYSVLLQLEQVLHTGELPAFGSVDDAPAAPIDAAVWVGYRLEHAPSEFPARSKVPIERMPLTLRAFSHQPVTSTALKRHFGYAYPGTRGTLHHRVIENIIVDRAAVMRLWPAAGAGTRRSKTGRVGQQGSLIERQKIAHVLEEWFRPRFNRPPALNETTADVVAMVRKKIPGLKVGDGVIEDEFRKRRKKWCSERGYNRAWDKRGRKSKNQS